MTCRHCGQSFLSPKKFHYCGNHRNLYSTPNRDRFRFHFNVFDYPDLFDLEKISRVGFYDGTVESVHRLTRDHKISVTKAIKNNYEPYYITHPLNCEIMSWKQNSLKRTKSSLSYSELVEMVDEYDSSKFKAGIEPATSILPK